MGDMFGDWVPELWHRLIYNTIRACPYHQFQILTKAPHNIHKNIKEWPKNTWIGTSLTGGEWPNVAHDRLRNIRKHNGIRFVSFEPLMNDGVLSYIDLCGIDWVIIGAQTNPTKIPDMNKIERVVTMADKAGAKVFIKNNILDSEEGAFCWPRRDFPVIK